VEGEENEWYLQIHLFLLMGYNDTFFWMAFCGKENAMVSINPSVFKQHGL